ARELVLGEPGGVVALPLGERHLLALVPEELGGGAVLGPQHEAEDGELHRPLRYLSYLSLRSAATPGRGRRRAPGPSRRAPERARPPRPPRSAAAPRWQRRTTARGRAGS